jgi:hypothetical protein
MQTQRDVLLALFSFQNIEVTPEKLAMSQFSNKRKLSDAEEEMVLERIKAGDKVWNHLQRSGKLRCDDSIHFYKPRSIMKSLQPSTSQ